MKKILILIGCLGLVGCSDELGFEDDELNIAQEDYVGVELMLNGYYYTTIGDPADRWFIIYTLHRNGIIRYMGSYRDTTRLVLNYPDEDKTSWGVFEVMQKEIRFERWYPSSGGGSPAYVREGTILDKNSFHISRSYRLVDGRETEEREEDEVYLFKPFSPKPDSITDFIK